MMGDHTVTVRATEDQHMAWTSAMSLLAQRNLGAFLRFAGDWTAQYYREECIQANMADPVLTRIVEKKHLRALLEAADAALSFIPKETNSPIRGPLPIKKDLKEAVQAVKTWLAAKDERVCLSRAIRWASLELARGLGSNPKASGPSPNVANLRRS